MKFSGTLSSNAAGYWTTNTNYTIRSVKSSTVMSFNVVSIGYNTVSNVGTFMTKNAPTTGNTVNSVLSGIGVSATYANGNVFPKNTAGTSLSITFNTVTANSFVVLMFASGGTRMTAFSTNAPGNSLVVNSVANTNQAQSTIIVVQDLAKANGYTATASTATSASIGIAAYVFNQQG